MSSYYLQILKSFGDQDLHQVTFYSNDFKNLLLDLDIVLQSDCTLIFGRWLDSARQFGKKVGDYNHLDIYEMNARSQVTRWGPNSEINDYASKQWSGLVKDYFLPRWDIFFETLKDSICNTVDYKDEVVTERIFSEVVVPFNKPGNYSTYCGGSFILINDFIFYFFFILE